MLTDGGLTDHGNESVAVTAGIWGFIVLFGLAIACWLLFRSMNNHLRKSQWQQEQDHPVRQRIPRATVPVEKETAEKETAEQQPADDSGAGKTDSA